MTNTEKILLGIGIAAASGVGGYFVYKYYFKMDLTNSGIELLKQLEGDGSKIYLDTRGFPTGGIGHKLLPADFAKLNITPDTALHTPVPKPLIKQWADKDFSDSEKAIRDTVKVSLKPSERDALLIFTHNVGVQGWKDSLLLREVNRKAPALDIIKAFGHYHRPNLETRRAKEARLFLTGKYSNYLTPAELKTYFIAP
jgi:GH24 family phage-related lysozyme (muramidase)